MFTGLVQSVGKIHLRGNGLLVEGCNPFSPLSIGDSISVDGVCLTAAEVVPNGFIADISEETINRSTLGEKAELGAFVNLEPALRLSDRLGGHLVSGHVDGIGKVLLIEDLKNSWNIQIKYRSKDFDRYLCEKASIALNGISLTISKVDYQNSNFSVAVIPHTWDNTSLKYLKIGMLVNLEADMMAKYAERLLKDLPTNTNNQNKKSIISSEITENWLEAQGW